jgi:hypothetical protein
MARVYFEYTKSALLEYPDYFMFVLFVVTSFMLVSVRDVFINMPKDSLSHIFRFYVAALRDTSLIIQVLISGFFVRVIIGSGILVYKNMDSRWSLAKLIRLKY